MRCLRTFSLAAIAFVSLSCVRPALAQSDAGEIVITVVDATNAPVANARTILIGPQTASSLTTLAGIIRYTDVPTGIYRVRVVKTGFTGASSREFDVLSGRSVNVRIALQPPKTAATPAATSTSGLRTIATVTTRTNISITTSDVGDGGPIRRLSNSLTDALDQIAGVSVTQDATDPTSAVTVSLANHDESQTAITLDGIPLSAPGTSANLRAIGTDLFSGSSASSSPAAGALGGGVNFRTLQPTQALQLHLNGTTGTYDRSNYQIAGTGSIGNLGLALQHTWRGSNSPLTFDEYRDQSGLTYAHEGESTSLGDFAKFRYRLGDERTTISGTALSNNLAATAVCARDTNLLPCGIGPGNGNDGRFGFAYANVASLVGDVTTSFTGYTSANRQTNNDANRYVLASPCVTLGDIVPEPGCNPAAGYDVTLSPSLSTNDTLTRGVAYSAAISPGRHTISLSGNTYASINTSVPIAGSRFEVPYATAISSSTYTLSDSYKVDERLTVTPHASLANTTTLGTSALGGLGASWQATRSDVLGASVDLGSSQPSININRSYSDPLGARYDCAARTALVSGPGDTNGGSQSAASLNLSAAHTFGFGGTFTASAFSQVQSGQLIGALIAEPASYFASQAGYLGDVASVFRSPTVCGANAGTPNVYVQESVGGTRRVYRGINLSGRVPFGRNLVAIANYSLNAAILEAASARLADGPSTTIVGEQLPNRPLHRGNVTLDGFLPRAGLELLANAQYTGGNNQQNLGPYVTFSAGISHGFGPGQVTLFENNVFDTYGGIFATDDGAAPLPLSNGASFRTSTTPLLPRTINLSYAVNIGGPRAGPAIASFGGRGTARAIAAAPTASPSPSSSGGGGGGGGGFGGGQFVPVAPSAGTDPLSLATVRTSCDADAQTAAASVFASLRAYVAAYEAKQTLPTVASLNVIAHVATVDPTVPYYLEIHPKLPRRPGATGGAPGGFGRGGGAGAGGGEPGGGPPGGGGPGGPGGGPPGDGPPGNAPSGEAGGPTDAQRAAFRALPEVRAYRGFTGCSYVTVLSATAGKAKGIVPPSSGRPGLYYVPKVGLVFVRPPELPQGGGSLKAGH